MRHSSRISKPRKGRKQHRNPGSSTQNRQCERQSPGGGPRCGTAYASNEYEGTVTVVPAGSPSPSHTFAVGGKDHPHGIAAAPDGIADRTGPQLLQIPRAGPPAGRYGRPGRAVGAGQALQAVRGRLDKPESAECAGLDADQRRREGAGAACAHGIRQAPNTDNDATRRARRPNGSTTAAPWLSADRHYGEPQPREARNAVVSSETRSGHSHSTRCAASG